MMNPMVKERRRSTKIKIRLLVLWIIVFTFVVGWNVHHLEEVDEFNRHLIEQIQASRLESCIRTYSVIQAVLDESASGRNLDAVSRARLNRMRELANPENCQAQVGVADLEWEGEE